MSFQLAPESFIKVLEQQIEGLKQQRQTLEDAQTRACSRGQCGGADFAAGVVPNQREIANVNEKINLIQSQIDNFKIDISQAIITPQPTITQPEITPQPEKPRESNNGILLALGLLGLILIGGGS